MAARALLCIFLVAAGTMAQDDDDDGLLKDMDETGAVAADIAEKVGTKFAAIYLGTYSADAHAYFEHYNRFKDGALQTLGPQEVRELLKDLEIGPFALRGEYASAFTQLLDADLDGRVSEAELRAVLDVASCWIDGSNRDAPLAGVFALGALAEAAPASTAGLRALMAAVRACSGLRSLWELHRRRTAKLEVALLRALALNQAHDSEFACAAAMIGPVTAATRGGGGVGAGALRRWLKALGMEPLLLR